MILLILQLSIDQYCDIGKYKAIYSNMKGGGCMNKKDWSKPELTILGIEKTEFDDSYTSSSTNCKPQKS